MLFTLVNLWGPKTTSFLGCSVHFFIFLFLGTTECILLTVMAFDRYVAICQPLCYTTIICPRLCRPPASMAWVISLLESVVHTPPTLRLPFCPHRQVDDCMRSQLSSDCPVGTPPPMRSRRLLPCAIAWAVLTINSTKGWRKAFGTCSSHLTGVTLFYSSVIAVYLQLENSYARKRGKFFGLFYAVGTPALNPVIYTLRNKEVKRAFRRLLGKDGDTRGS
uniref:Olfactory receptor family 2 subfamily H member 2 n=1 Tax=Ursus americanus TaxID=9643 RepID=A0A452R2N9_URSAM